MSSNTSLGDPFIELLTKACEEHAQLPKYEANKYGNLVMYWTHEEFSKDFQVSCAVMHAPTSWSKASGLTCEYVYLCMHLEFYQFRLLVASLDKIVSLLDGLQLWKRESSKLFSTSIRHNFPSIQQCISLVRQHISKCCILNNQPSCSVCQCQCHTQTPVVLTRVAFMKMLANSLQDGGNTSGIELVNAKVTRESALASSMSMRSTTKRKQACMNAKQAAIPDILQIAANQNGTGTSSLSLEIKDEAAETHIKSL
ncbi:hypothetical protein PAXINDRAFT_157317 [Paxillus involutus ATCC 200175]|uniref:Uncharacterized protein n=1 Tax=Paxillus involutus ATCC 200175 TaxID=664439 RepID=A0A0C9SSN6_PAXIN|nr:hypothetical protein PAXINDRAFT_157317 [Paxillus involutus ATCC 200175]